ncbi:MULTISPECIES: diguanylate cyclase domain-containing protein [Undibacterium]|jgi:two-component system cell cycle response regulator|uniref:diguanylate cyclase n=1 Tax=Undibacterium umbellatum TaxID=2762300 RepID=A0ABR6Z7U0_9BURK|nr:MULTISPECIES: diguanylate cyclase [Undibacterium]MBC3907644.1 diguanylate cyclase [Undibacterium umbellatum]MDP1978874.1 diguanylate cyclase [Undibacterium sp.]
MFRLGSNPARNREMALLIVDDMPDNIGVLRGMLLPYGHQLFVATSGQGALNIAAQVPLDLILLDVMMPGMDGFETCRMLKANPQTRETPIIFITAKTDTQDIVEGFNLGAADYINKPVRMEEAQARIQTQLQIRSYILEQREQAERMRAIVNNMAEGLLIIEADGRIQSSNPAADYLFGYAPDQLQGHSIFDLLDTAASQEYHHYFSRIASDGSGMQIPQHGSREVQIKHHSGAMLNVDLSIMPMFVRQPLFVGLLHDITRHKLSEHALRREASMDALTNVANRRHFDASLENIWQYAVENEQELSLILLDVDHFKHYNDTLGHQAGDRCLQQVAQVLRTIASPPATLIARYGGEEFVILLPNTGQQDAHDLACQVQSAMEARQLAHPASTCSAWVTVSIGVCSLRPNAAISSELLFLNADQAMYQAKESGRNRVCTEFGQAEKSV